VRGLVRSSNLVVFFVALGSMVWLYAERQAEQLTDNQWWIGLGALLVLCLGCAIVEACMTTDPVWTLARKKSEPQGFPIAPRKSSGFTLIEVMISLAITALLVIAISNIFTTASKTVGAGFALGDAVKAHKAIGQTLRSDFEGLNPNNPNPLISGATGIVPSTEMPSIIIHSSRVAAFRDQNDERSSAAFIPTDTAANRDDQIRSVDYDGDGAMTVAERIPRAIYGYRNFRTDTLSFFSRGTFTRQTGDGATGAGAVSNVYSNEAWIWYGHTRVYNGIGGLMASGSYLQPGEGNHSTNPTNFYASTFALGRSQMLLLAKYDHDGNAATNDTLADASGAEVRYYWHDWLPNTAQEVTPLSVNSAVCAAAGPPQVLQPILGASQESPQLSWYDLADASLPQLYTRVKSLQDGSATAGVRPDWWQTMFATDLGRFWCNPYPTKPFTTKNLSQTSQILIQGASSFIVEYAGDYLTQDILGRPTAATPDGTIDYIIQNPGVNQVRGVRWYGFPRDIDGDRHIYGGRTATGWNLMIPSPDVVPLRDLRNVIAAGTAPFEKTNTILTVKNDYVGDPATATVGVALGQTYDCAWGPLEMNPAAGTPLTPKMIRVVLQVMDVNGRLPDGVTQEYVFKCR
jgi:prepilin-type N-terminal cleavage/methylation domain-containing protein